MAGRPDSQPNAGRRGKHRPLADRNHQTAPAASPHARAGRRQVGHALACRGPRFPPAVIVCGNTAMAKLRLTMACWNYDRTRALLEHRVPVDGIELNYLNLPVEETFFRMLRHREFDVAEMSLSSYVMSLFKPEPPFVAIPVFPSRCFRHS